MRIRGIGGITTDRRKQRYQDTKNATRTGSGTRKLIAVFGQKWWYADRKMVLGQIHWHSDRNHDTRTETVVLGHKQRYLERNILQRQPLYDISYKDCPRTEPGPPRSETGHPLNRIGNGHVCFPRVSLTTHTHTTQNKCFRRQLQTFRCVILYGKSFSGL
jgi:hypothetical protein